jgi:hypothetical protein
MTYVNIAADSACATERDDDDGRDIIYLRPGERVTARTAGPAECRARGVGLFTLLLVIHGADGTEELYRADQTTACFEQPRNLS